MVKVSKKATKDYGELSQADAATVADLKLAFENAARLRRYRQGFKLADADCKLVALNDDKKTLSSYGVKSGAKLQVKDLGPQIGDRTVLLLECLGPLLLALFYAAFVYDTDTASKPQGHTAWLGVVACSAHFLKREFETVSMPASCARPCRWAICSRTARTTGRSAL